MKEIKGSPQNSGRQVQEASTTNHRRCGTVIVLIRT